MDNIETDSREEHGAESGAMGRIAETSNLYLQEVTWVHHWTDELFSFRVKRPAAFRFRSGEFVMIGLAQGDRAVLRAYSIASPSWGDELEFFSIKVDGGKLTSRLRHLRVGDHVFVGKKPTGTLVLDALLPGKRLFMIGTGTGLAPFLSVLRDPEVGERFERIILTHTVRREEELAYRRFLEHEIRDDEFFGDVLRDKLTYYPTVTQSDFKHRGRITDRIREGLFANDVGLIGNRFNPDESRVMLCGSMAFNKEMAAMLDSHGLTEGSNAQPGSYVVERAFVG